MWGRDRFAPTDGDTTVVVVVFEVVVGVVALVLCQQRALG
jgi:hypothetical protein